MGRVGASAVALAALAAGCATAGVTSERMPAGEGKAYTSVLVSFEGEDEIQGYVIEAAVAERSPALVRDSADARQEIDAVLTIAVRELYAIGGAHREPPPPARREGVVLAAPEGGLLRAILEARLTDAESGRLVWTATVDAKAGRWDESGHRMLRKAAQELARRVVQDGLIAR